MAVVVPIARERVGGFVGRRERMWEAEGLVVSGKTYCGCELGLVVGEWDGLLCVGCLGGWICCGWGLKELFEQWLGTGDSALV